MTDWLCAADRFLAGDDKEAEQRRSCMFKLIPSVVKGSWVIKQAVGNTPVLLGKKLTTRYYRSTPQQHQPDTDYNHTNNHNDGDHDSENCYMFQQMPIDAVCVSPESCLAGMFWADCHYYRCYSVLSC